nr:hypothetical protein [Bacilli bacterium]
MSENDLLAVDREDLLAIITMRFGAITKELRALLLAMEEPPQVERLILVAANAPSPDILLDEIKQGDTAFRITGSRFDPLAREIKEDC